MTHWAIFLSSMIPVFFSLVTQNKEAKKGFETFLGDIKLSQRIHTEHREIAKKPPLPRWQACVLNRQLLWLLQQRDKTTHSQWIVCPSVYFFFPSTPRHLDKHVSGALLCAAEQEHRDHTTKHPLEFTEQREPELTSACLHPSSAAGSKSSRIKISVTTLKVQSWCVGNMNGAEMSLLLITSGELLQNLNDRKDGRWWAPHTCNL